MWLQYRRDSIPPAHFNFVGIRVVVVVVVEWKVLCAEDLGPE